MRSLHPAAPSKQLSVYVTVLSVLTVLVTTQTDCPDSCRECNSKGECRFCKVGFYKTGFSTCTACAPFCADCSDATCITCYTGNYLNLGSGSPCSFKCDACTSFATCTRCAEGYFVAADGACEKCFQTCKTCSDQASNNCFTCIDGYEKFGGNCEVKQA